jgi:hypothetical protein
MGAVTNGDKWGQITICHRPVNGDKWGHNPLGVSPSVTGMRGVALRRSERVWCRTLATTTRACARPRRLYRIQVSPARTRFCQRYAHTREVFSAVIARVREAAGAGIISSGAPAYVRAEHNAHAAQFRPARTERRIFEDH